MKKSIEVNNGRKIELEFMENGISIKTITKNGEIESTDYIDDGEFVMLFNLHQALRRNGEKSAYILNDFARQILIHTYSMDSVEEYQIFN